MDRVVNFGNVSSREFVRGDGTGDGNEGFEDGVNRTSRGVPVVLGA